MAREPVDSQGNGRGEGTSVPFPFQANGRLLSTKDAAQYLNLSIWTLRDLIWKGELPIVRFGRKQYLDVKDLNALIERNKTTLI